jgi:hypothetical protein
MKAFYHDESQNPETEIDNLRDEPQAFKNRPALKDEMVLNVDAILSVDPAKGLHDRAQKFVSSRQWTTLSIFYGDQAEPEYPEESPMWSMSFCLGLDHVPKTQADWFADVEAIVEFVHAVALETGCEFCLEFRLSSSLWYSHTLAFVDDDPDNKIDLEEINSMLERLIKCKSSWWRRLLGI